MCLGWLRMFGGESKQPLLAASAGLEAELLVTQLRDDAPLARALEVAFHDQVWFIDLFESVRFLAHRHPYLADAGRATAELHYHGLQDALVHFVEAILVDLEHGQRLVGN